MKVIAFYLPQYHSIKENDLWWGKGYTEWDSLKRGTILTDKQYQPRVPLNQNYYNLLDIDVMRWQTSLAKKYGVYGFCVYHYWFNGKLLLEKPMENFLNSDIDFPFFFCWANENWTTVWEGNTKTLKTLIAHNYEDRSDWKKHFDYLLLFFKDERYIKEDNKPILVIYDPVLCKYSTLKKMLSYWNELAILNGFDGIKYFYQSPRSLFMMTMKERKLFDSGIEYCPSINDAEDTIKRNRFRQRIINRVSYFLRKINKSLLDKKEDIENQKYDVKIIQNYDEEWGKIISRTPLNNNIYPGAFVDWDNTPRRMKKGKVILGANPDKFKHYFKQQIIRAKAVYKKDMIFVFAWNEWSEGGYLEPDETYRYAYLEAIRESLIETNEFPNSLKNGQDR